MAHLYTPIGVLSCDQQNPFTDTTLQMEDVPVAPLSGMRRWLFNAKNFVNIVPEKCKLLLYISINDSMLLSVCFYMVRVGVKVGLGLV